MPATRRFQMTSQWNSGRAPCSAAASIFRIEVHFRTASRRQIVPLRLGPRANPDGFYDFLFFAHGWPAKCPQFSVLILRHKGKLVRISCGWQHCGRHAAVAAILIAICLTGCKKSPEKVRAESLARAAAFMQQEQYGNAIIEYKNAIKADPKSPELYSLLGDAYMKDTEYREAYLSFERVLQLSPGDYKAQLAIGQVLLRSGMNDDALQLAKELASTHPEVPEARMLLANAYQAKGMNALAIDELKSLLASQPRLTAAHINLGMFYASAAKRDLAEAELQKALQLEPQSFDARKALAALYINTGRMADAEKVYQAAVANAPSSPGALLTLADFYILTKRPAEAEQLYQRVVALQNNSVPARFALARFYVAQGRFEDARRLDEAIAAEKQDFIPARVQLAELALNSGDLAKAAQLTALLLQTQQRNTDVQILNARILLKQRKPQRAIEVLESVIKQGNLPAAHFLLGVAYNQLGNVERASNEMQVAVSIDPAMADAYVGLGEIMLNRNQPKAAMEYAQLAMQHSPNRTDVLVLAGSAAANMHNLALAEKFLQAYSAAVPNSADGYNRLGNLRLIQKRDSEALAYYEKSLAVAPRNYGALDGIASTLVRKGDRGAAVARVQAVLSQGETPELLSLAGKIYLEVGNQQAAEDVLKRALQHSSEIYAPYVQLGGLYARSQRLPEAINYFNSAVKMRPGDIASWTMLGMLYQQTGDLQKAENSYTHALDIEPNAGVAANNLAWLYADHMNDMDKALELARRAKVALPNVPNVSDTLGWIYAKRKLNDMAIPLLMEAVKGEPGHAEYHYHLAVALMQSGKKAAARGEMSSAIRLDSSIRGRDQARDILQ